MSFAFRCLHLATLALIVTSSAIQADAAIVKFFTNKGSFSVRMFESTMPNSVTNFLSYVEAERYDQTFIHRSTTVAEANLAVVQGGGMRLPTTGTQVVDRVNGQLTFTVPSVTTFAPINDEPGNGVTGPSNVRGTIAMAKSGKNTATSQWYFNVSSNTSLDNPARPDGGFSAFGRVLGNGMTVVDAINALPTPAGELPALNGPKVVAQDYEYLVNDMVIVQQVRLLDLPEGDYNFDGAVNNADYLIWKNSFGSKTAAEADGNGDGVVNSADFTVWRDSVIAAGQSVTIPEPTSAAIVALGMLGAGFRRRV